MRAVGVGVGVAGLDIEVLFSRTSTPDQEHQYRGLFFQFEKTKITCKIVTIHYKCMYHFKSSNV